MDGGEVAKAKSTGSSCAFVGAFCVKYLTNGLWLEEKLVETEVVGTVSGEVANETGH